jgi:hypothetical protein
MTAGLKSALDEQDVQTVVKSFMSVMSPLLPSNPGDWHLSRANTLPTTSIHPSIHPPRIPVPARYPVSKDVNSKHVIHL